MFRKIITKPSQTIKSYSSRTLQQSSRCAPRVQSSSLFSGSRNISKMLGGSRASFCQRKSIQPSSSSLTTLSAPKRMSVRSSTHNVVQKASHFVTSRSTRKFSTQIPDFSQFKVGHLNHVAIAVPDLQKSAAMYRDVLGAKISAPLELPEHGVTTIFVELGNTKLELLHPLGAKSPIQNFLDKKPSGGIHHICLEVEDIHQALQKMKTNNVKVIDENPKIGAHGKPVVFLHPKGLDGVLLELEQK